MGVFVVFALPIACGTEPQTPTGEPERAARAKELSPHAAAETPVVDPGFVEAATLGRRGPEIITRQVLQGAGGDLWLASYSGFYRYDGERFTNITNLDGLQPTRAFSLLRDHADQIWLGTLGAGVYRVEEDGYTNIRSADGLAGDRVLFMMEDREHNIWFGFEGAGATRYDGSEFTSFGERDGFSSGDVSSMAQGPSGTIWFGTREGLFQFDGERFEKLSSAWGLTEGGYIPTLVDRSGELWFGGADGLFRYAGGAPQQVSSDPSWALLEQDAAGHIWFTGGGAIKRVDPQTRGADSEPEVVKVAEAEELVFDIFEDREGTLWIGSLQGLGRVDGDVIRYPADGLY